MSRFYAGALRQFGRVPAPVRHKIVGLTSPSYRIGTVAVIITDSGSVLLVKHTYRNGWGLPGGMMGWREEPLAAIEREVREEVGLTVEPMGSPHVEHMAKPRRVEWYFDLRLREGCVEADAKVNSPEIEEVRWFPLGELPRLEKETPTTARALAEITARRFPGRLRL